MRGLEETRNCRVSVGRVSVRMFALPARVEVSDIKIIPRDESRKPATPGETFVHIDRMLLEVNIWSLLLGNLDIERALVDGVKMQTVMDEREKLPARPAGEARERFPAGPAAGHSGGCG